MTKALPGGMGEGAMADNSSDSTRNKGEKRKKGTVPSYLHDDFLGHEQSKGRERNLPKMVVVVYRGRWYWLLVAIGLTIPKQRGWKTRKFLVE